MRYANENGNVQIEAFLRNAEKETMPLEQQIVNEEEKLESIKALKLISPKETSILKSLTHVTIGIVQLIDNNGKIIEPGMFFNSNIQIEFYVLNEKSNDEVFIHGNFKERRGLNSRLNNLTKEGGYQLVCDITCPSKREKKRVEDQNISFRII